MEGVPDLRGWGLWRGQVFLAPRGLLVLSRWLVVGFARLVRWLLRRVGCLRTARPTPWRAPVLSVNSVVVNGTGAVAVVRTGDEWAGLD